MEALTVFVSERQFWCLVISTVLGARRSRMKSLLLLFILYLALGQVIIQKEVRTTTIIIDF